MNYHFTCKSLQVGVVGKTAGNCILTIDSKFRTRFFLSLNRIEDLRDAIAKQQAGGARRREGQGQRKPRERGQVNSI